MTCIFSRLFALINISIVICGFVFYIPAYSIAGKTLKEGLESRNVEHLVALVEKLLIAKSAYDVYFFKCSFPVEVIREKTILIEAISSTLTMSH